MAAVADDVGAAAAGDGKELRDSRFSHLLQPIRDLAANWDINIAGELEEYLEELESLTFAVEGCAGPALNFAEAALLIQVCCNVIAVTEGTRPHAHAAVE
jgi:Condensin II complex subunit CAP-H2 or CNDH2, N-terminal